MGDEVKTNVTEHLSSVDVVQNGTNGSLSDLSYKELQGLAISKNLPGNLKWSQLLVIVQARQRGDEATVASIVNSSREQRGKRRQVNQGEVKKRRMSIPNCNREYYMGSQAPGGGGMMIPQIGQEDPSSRNMMMHWSRRIAPMPNSPEVAITAAQVLNPNSREYFPNQTPLLQNLLANTSCAVTTSQESFYNPNVQSDSRIPTNSYQSFCLKNLLSDNGNYPQGTHNNVGSPQSGHMNLQMERFNQNNIPQSSLVNTGTVSPNQQFAYHQSLQSDSTNPQVHHVGNDRLPGTALTSSPPYHFLHQGQQSDSTSSNSISPPFQYYPGVWPENNRTYNSGPQFPYRQGYPTDVESTAMCPSPQPPHFHHSMRPPHWPVPGIPSPADVMSRSFDNRRAMEQRYGHGLQAHDLSLQNSPHGYSSGPPPLLPITFPSGMYRPRPIYTSTEHRNWSSETASVQEIDPCPPIEKEVGTMGPSTGEHKAATATVTCYNEPICTSSQFPNPATPLAVEPGSPGVILPDEPETFINMPEEEKPDTSQSSYFPEFVQDNQLSFPLIYNYVASTEDQLLQQQNQQASPPSVALEKLSLPPTPEPHATSSPVNPDVPQLDESTLALIYGTDTKPTRNPCKYQHNGCLLWMEPDQLSQHERICEHQDFCCLVQNCTWKHPLRCLSLHLIEDHPDIISSGVEKSHMVPLHILRAEQKMIFIQEVGNRHYLVAIHCQGHLMHASIQAIPSGRDRREVTARGSIEVIASDGRPLAWCGRIRLVQEPVTNLWSAKQCLTLDPSAMGLHAGSKITLHTKITMESTASRVSRRKKQQNRNV